MKIEPALACVAYALLVFSGSSCGCTVTDFQEDGVQLTAALVNPIPTVTSYVNGNGCDIGVYYSAGHSGKVEGAWIYASHRYGILANGDHGRVHVDVVNTTIQNIGTGPGTGVGIYYRSFSNTGRAEGTMSYVGASGYWSTGIVANGPGTDVTIEHGIIGSYRPTEEGLVGVQIGFGAHATISDSEIFHNSSYWINSSDASPGIGVLVVGGPAFGVCPGGESCEYTRGVKVEGNQILQNDVGILLINASKNFTAPQRSTANKIVHNYIWDDECVNDLYQVAIADLGKQDVIAGNSNTIEGRGYLACGTYYNPNSISLDWDPVFVPAHAIK